MSSSSAEVLVEFGGQRAAVVYTGDDAFCGRTFGGTFEEPNLALQTVVIQEGVTRIDDNAFSHCPNLASVTIAKTVLSIGKLAFQGCASLASADLPASTKSIGNDAFSGCTSLKCINLPPGLKSIEDNLFLGCTSLGSIGIPTTVTSIGKYAFYRCSSLTSIVIPPRVTSVKEWTFYECFGLVSVSLPTVLSVIEAYAFQNCTALTSITVPTQVQTIGLQAFCGCKSLSSITLPMSLATIGKRAFGECCRLDAMLKVCPQWPQVKILNKTNLPQAIDAKAAAWGEKGGRGGTYAVWGYVGKSSRNPLGRAYDVAAILCTVEIAKSIMKVVAIVEKNQKKSLSLGEGEVSKTDHADMLLENAEGPSVSIFVRLEITNAPSIGNKPGFVPPQLQPRALRLKEAARALQKSMFPKDGNFTMDSEIHRIIEHLFVPLARHHFAECVELSRGIVAEMRSEYDSVRKGHLLIYGDTLRQVRQEPTFAELQRRSNKLVNDCQELAEISQLQGGNRPFMQLANTVCGLYCGAVAVSKRYNKLLGQVASKTGASFISAPQKGLMRVCEKLGLEPAPRNWEPERVTDLVRGAIKCDSFTTMLNVLRLLCDLDGSDRLKISGETGGISDKIWITRSKGRFGQPTSGGWADIMINFCFQDDKEQHVCELQLVHTQLYTVRKNMGAHKTYSIFRAALELCEMVGADPEEGADTSELDALVWTGAGSVEVEGSPSLAYATDWKAEAEMLRGKVSALETKAEKVVGLETALQQETERVSFLMEKLASLESRVEKVAILEVEVAKVAKLEADLGSITEYLQNFGPKVGKRKSLFGR